MTVSLMAKGHHATSDTRLGEEGVGAVWAGSGLWRVPPMPGTLRMLVTSGADHSLDVEKVARAVSMDEVLSAHALRLANSAALGFRSSVYSVEQAIARIGCGTVRSMALALAVSQSLSLPWGVGGLPRVRLWAHNWAVAWVAAALAGRYGLRRSEAHLCGLLHDVGKLVWAACKPEGYRACVEQAKQEEQELIRVERAVMGQSHCVVGEGSLQAWGLPAAVVEAAGQHHRPWVDSTVSAAGRLVRVANAIAHAAGIGESGNVRPPSLEECLEHDSELTQVWVDRCLQGLERERPDIEELAQRLGE